MTKQPCKTCSAPTYLLIGTMPTCQGCIDAMFSPRLSCACANRRLAEAQVGGIIRERDLQEQQDGKGRFTLRIGPDEAIADALDDIIEKAALAVK